jgi:hypothetical protein
MDSCMQFSSDFETIMYQSGEMAGFWQGSSWLFPLGNGGEDTGEVGEGPLKTVLGMRRNASHA